MKAFAALLMFLSISLTAHAAVEPVRPLEGAVTYYFPHADRQSVGPEMVAPGITWTATVTSSFGATSPADFRWTSWRSFSHVRLGSLDENDYMVFDFEFPVRGVAAFVNFLPGVGSSFLRVFDEEEKMLSEINLSAAGFRADIRGYDYGLTLGFLSDEENIKSFRLYGAAVAAASLKVVGPDLYQALPVPEAPSFALYSAGLALLALRFRVSSRQ